MCSSTRDICFVKLNFSNDDNRSMEIVIVSVFQHEHFHYLCILATTQYRISVDRNFN